MSNVIRCLRCKLNQFETASGLCRRCGVKFPSVPQLPQVVSAQVMLSLKANILGIALRTYREARGWKRSELGRRMGNAEFRVNIYRIEEGIVHSSLHYAERLAEALGIPLRWLFGPVSQERLDELFAVDALLIARERGVSPKTVLAEVGVTIRWWEKLRKVG